MVSKKECKLVSLFRTSEYVKVKQKYTKIVSKKYLLRKNM